MNHRNKRAPFPNNYEETRFTWSEFLSEVAKRPRVPNPATETPGDATFYGTSSFEAAMDLAIKGWNPGRSRMMKTHDRLMAAVKGGEQFAPRYEVTGDEVDVGEFLTGEPECMIEYQMAPARKPVVKLVVGCALSCAIEGSSYERRGAVILAAIEAAEEAGVRVELWADYSRTNRVEYSRVPEHKISHRVKVKDACDPVEVDRLAFAMMNPAMVRRLMWRTHEIYGPTQFDKCGGGAYGYPAAPEYEECAVVVDCIFGGNDPWSDDDGAIEQLKKLSEELTAAVE